MSSPDKPESKSAQGPEISAQESPPTGPVEAPADEDLEAVPASTIIAQSEEDWDEAIEEWDHNLHLGAQTDPPRSVPQAPDRSPMPGAFAAGIDEEADPLPPLPQAPRPLPDFQMASSVPPTLIADLDSVFKLTEEEVDQAVDIAEAELPPAPASDPQAVTSQRSPHALRSSRSPVREAASFMEPSHPEEGGADLNMDDLLDGELDLGLGPLPLPPPPERSAPEQAAPEQAAAGEPSGESETPPAQRPLPVDEEFYDVISIEKAEAQKSLPPSSRRAMLLTGEDPDERGAPDPGQQRDDEHEGLDLLGADEPRFTREDPSEESRRSAPRDRSSFSRDLDRTPVPGEEPAGMSPTTTIHIDAELPPGVGSVVTHLPEPPAGPDLPELPVALPRRKSSASRSPGGTRSPIPPSVLTPLARSSLTPALLRSGTTPAELQARRLPLPPLPKADQGLPGALPLHTSRTAGLTPEARRELVTVLDAETQARLETDRGSAARLALFAARQSEILREPADALDRYRTVLELFPRCRPALRGLRRLLSLPGPAAQPDEAVGYLEREMELSSATERRALLLQRGELLLSLSQPRAAQACYHEALDLAKTDAQAAPVALSATTGLCDAALGEAESSRRTADLAAALDLMLGPSERPMLDPAGALSGALQIERARLHEVAGQDREALLGHEQVLSRKLPGLMLPAAAGLLRTGLRLRGTEAGGRALGLGQRFVLGHHNSSAPSAPSGLRRGLLRWMATAPAAGPEALTEEERRAALLLAGQGDDADRLVLSDLAQEQEEQGLLPSAARSYAALAQKLADPAHRADALTRAGEMHERLGQLAEAQEVLEQALSAAAESDTGGDAVAARALERVDRRSGRREALLALMRQEARSQPGRAAFAHLTAARLLLAAAAEEAGGAGATEEAIAELSAALSGRRAYAPAVVLLRELLVRAGRPEEAARMLLRAAPSIEEEAPQRSDSALRLFYREDAARLLGKSGHAAEAARILLGELPHVLEQSARQALRWLVQHLLTGWGRTELAPETEPELANLLAETLRAEAEQTQDRQRAADLWFRRGLLLGPLFPLPTPEGGPVEDSLQRALSLEPAHGPALLALTGRALAAELVAPVPEQKGKDGRISRLLQQVRERLVVATGRPEVVMMLLRLGALQEYEAQDIKGALATLTLLRSVAPGHPGAATVEEAVLILARRAGDKVGTLEILERELSREKDEDRRFALLLHIGELYESQKQPKLAAARFEQALELRHGHPVARAALARVYQSAGLFAELIALTETEISEAVDVAGRVAGYERIASLSASDPQKQGDPKDAIEAYRSILAVDANHHVAMRVLERHFIAEENIGDVIHLYEQMGLTASDPAFAVHIHLDRARLRQRLAWQMEREGQGNTQIHNELENDFRLALFRDAHSRPALRYVLASALRSHDLNQVADLSIRLADICDQSGTGRGEAGDGRAAGVFLTRAAECYEKLQRPQEVVTQAYRAALERNPRHLPAIRGLLHFAVGQNAWEDVAATAELCAAALHEHEQRYRYFLLAGAVAQEQLRDAQRAIQLYREALRTDPQRADAFDRLRVLLSGHGGAPADPQALSELLVEHLQVEEDPQRQIAMRLELASLLCDALGNRARAKVELRAALGYDPSHPAVLEVLGNLHYEDAEWTEAADLLIRRARLERRPDALADIFLRLGQIYSEHLLDGRRAVASYKRALELMPDHVAVLSQLSALYLAQQRPEAAVPLLQHLQELSPDREQKVAYLQRIARLHEGQGDKRAALDALRQAVDIDPMYLPAVGELAHYFDRQSDVQSMRVHLDRSAARYRQLLREHPEDASVYQALLQIYLWRRAMDQATLCAEVIVVLTGQRPQLPEAGPLLEKQRARESYPGEGLRDPGLDEILFPPALSLGLRNLFAFLQEPLGKLYRTDMKKLQQMGIDKRERLPRSGHPLRELANRLAQDLHAGDFEIYVTAAQGRDEAGRPVPLCTVEATEVPSLILSQGLLSGATEAELRFLLARLLKLLQSHMVLPYLLGADDLGVLVGGLVRIFVPDHVPIGYAEKRIGVEAQRLQKVIPRRLNQQLLPLAMECSTAALDLSSAEAALTTCMDRIGLLAAGSVLSAYAALRRLGPAVDQQLKELLRFAVSDEFAEARRLAGTSLG